MQRYNELRFWASLGNSSAFERVRREALNAHLAKEDDTTRPGVMALQAQIDAIVAESSNTEALIKLQRLSQARLEALRRLLALLRQQ